MAVTVRVAVIGVGNEFRRDDGVAWQVVARLKQRAERRPLPDRWAAEGARMDKDCGERGDKAGFDPVTGMQEPKATLCQVRAA